MDADRADFERFATVEAPPSSPLYASLASIVARDDSLLALVRGRIVGEPGPNLLFGAVHRRLADRRDHPLAEFFPSISGVRPVGGDLEKHFRAFCHEEASALRAIVRARRVQTNEARRSGVLLPVLLSIARREGRPVALVDVGTSAGLTLLVPRWRVTYRGLAGCVEIGPEGALVRFEIEVRGPSLPPVAGPPLELASAIGIDPEPVDASDEESACWLEALVWPEQADRLARIRAALAEARAHPPRIERGDAVERLAGVLAALPPHAIPVVTHTHVLSKIPPDGRRRLDAVFVDASKGRRVHRVGNDFTKADGGIYAVEQRTYVDGDLGRAVVARCDGHATWMEWLGPD